MYSSISYRYTGFLPLKHINIIKKGGIILWQNLLRNKDKI